jgi:hypothetical protein
MQAIAKQANKNRIAPSPKTAQKPGDVTGDAILNAILYDSRHRREIVVQGNHCDRKDANLGATLCQSLPCVYSGSGRGIRPDLRFRSDVMWTLILVTFVVSGAATGGVGTSTSFIDFPDEAKCRAAAEAMAETNQVSLGQVGTRPNISPSAVYRIIAKCVARGPQP